MDEPKPQVCVVPKSGHGMRVGRLCSECLDVECLCVHAGILCVCVCVCVCVCAGMLISLSGLLRKRGGSYHYL